MGDKSKIQWTDATWNPTTGCTKVSPGCANCYAKRVADRLQKCGVEKYRNGFDLTLHPDDLAIPLRWKKPRMIFVDSMSDLFHKDVPFEFIDQVFAVMSLCPQHTFQVLTKRPERMAEYLLKDCRFSMIDFQAYEIRRAGRCPYERNFPITSLPLVNAWLGTSVENQAQMERFEYLRETPATVRFLSCEPLLGPLNIPRTIALDWVIVGGESGPKARPMIPEWVRSIRDQCVSVTIPLFFKQWGDARPGITFASEFRDAGHDSRAPKGGRLLDGREWNEFPQSALTTEKSGT